MLLARVTPPTTSAATPTGTPSTQSAMSRTSTYNTVSFIIAAVALTVGFTIFYQLYWRKRPSNPEPRLCVSRAGVARFVTGDARERRERERILEQAQREQGREQCAAEWRTRRVEESPRDGARLPKYSRSPEFVQSTRPEMEGVGSHVVIQVPPPTYDQTVARPPSPRRTYA